MTTLCLVIQSHGTFHFVRRTEIFYTEIKNKQQQKKATI